MAILNITITPRSTTAVPAAYDRQLTLVVPGLWGPGTDPIAPGIDVRALATILARADTVPAQGSGLEAVLFALFGLTAADDADLPVAAVTRVLDMGVVDKGWWLRADPVYLQPDRDRLILSDNELLQVTQAEADQLVDEIMQTFSADGWMLKAARPGRWYLKPPRPPRLQTTPLADVIGRDIHPYLPRGKDGRHWHTVLNEVQILLHTAAANAAREARGQLPVNSLWFWGGGKLPGMKSASWTHVYSQEPVSLALARLVGVSSRGTPPDYADWARQATPSGRHLVVLDQMRAAVQYHQVDAWRAFVVALEHDWIAPALTAIKRRELHVLALYDDQGRGYRLTSSGARRWWRRRVEFPRHRP